MTNTMHATQLSGFAAVLMIPTIGCQHSGAKVEVNRPPQPLQVVAVEPVLVHFPGRHAEAARQTLVLLDSLWRDSKWGVITPEEFKVLDPTSTDYLHATNLVVVTHDLGLDPKRFGVLKATLSAREAKGQAVVAGGGKVAIGRNYEGFIDAVLELTSADGKPLATATAVTRIDPFAQLPEHDEAPWIREALTTAARGRFAECVGCVVDAPRATFPLVANPAVVYSRSGDFDQVTRGDVTDDRLERQQERWRFFQFFDPTCSVADAERLAKLGDSVCAGATAELPFQPGDCITAMNGRVYRSPHTLIRALKGSTSVMLDVVDKDGARRTVNGLDLLP